MVTEWHDPLLVMAILGSEIICRSRRPANDFRDATLVVVHPRLIFIFDVESIHSSFEVST